MTAYLCPLCAKALAANPRYPSYICGTCENKATDAQGRAVYFANTSIGGGCQGYYRDDQSLYQSLDCYVEGRRCRAQEHRFGGIVIQLKES